MIFTHVTPDQVHDVTRSISEQLYDGNVVVEWVKNPRMAPNLLNTKGTRFRGRIVVFDSRGSGARRSWSGRHGPWACWHVFRDVLEEVIGRYGANVTTGRARYTPATWYDRYPGTGTVNMGSVWQPARLVDLCDCGGGLRNDETWRDQMAQFAGGARRITRTEPTVEPVAVLPYDVSRALDFMREYHAHTV